MSSNLLSIRLVVGQCKAALQEAYIPSKGDTTSISTTPSYRNSSPLNINLGQGLSTESSPLAVLPKLSYRRRIYQRSHPCRFLALFTKGPHQTSTFCNTSRPVRPIRLSDAELPTYKFTLTCRTNWRSRAWILRNKLSKRIPLQTT